MIAKLYVDDVLYSVQKALYYERGRGSYFRSTMVGAGFLSDDEISGDSPEAVINDCIRALKQHGIIKDATFQLDDTGKLYTFTLTDSVHLASDQRLIDDGVPPFICPPVNIILDKICRRFGLAVEIADIDVDLHTGTHVVNVVVFEQNL